MYNIRLNSEEESEIVGNYPQIISFLPDYDSDEINSIYNTKYDEIPDFHPTLNAFVLDPKSKLTDFVSSFYSNIYLNLSDKVKSILEKYNLPQSEFYPVVLNRGKEKYPNYWWFYYISNGIKYIDFNHSLFIIRKFPFKKNQPFKVRDLDELLEVRKRCRPGAETLVLYKCVVKDEIRKVDFFDFGFLDLKKYISNKLAEDLLSNEVTGVVINEVDNIVLSKR